MAEGSLTEVLHQMTQIADRMDVIVSDQEIVPIHFSEWALTWLDTWRKGVVSNITYDETYARPVKHHLVPYFGDYYLHEITPLDVQKFFNIQAQKYTIESCKKMKNPLHSIFETGIENNHCHKNPVTSTIKIWSKIPNMTKKTWNQEQFDLAYDFALNRKDGLPILILMETAVSRSELLGLTWKDFSYENRVLYINGGIIGCIDADTGKWRLERSNLKNRFRHRIVPISTITAERINNLPRKITLPDKSQKRPDLIFCNSLGRAKEPDNWYKREFKPFMKDLHAAYSNIPILTTHELRHTRATLLNYQGVDLYTISRLMGHCDLTMLSKRYLHDDVDAMRKKIGI